MASHRRKFALMQSTIQDGVMNGLLRPSLYGGMEETPFGPNHELCHQLEVNGAEIRRRHPKPNAAANLPGEPRIQLTDSEIGERLKAELMTEVLNQLAPHLWLMTTQSSENISSLTDQVVRGREITVTENPGLHLVWIYHRVFIKPLPKYLLSHAFWEYYLLSKYSPIKESVRKDLLQAALGFLRSYAYLIRHKSDFTLATQEKTRLIPKNISYSDFVNFINRFKVADELVSLRYHFGELRLRRLNFWCKVFLFESTYHPVEWEYGAYFAQYYAPMLFIFAVFSLLMSAM